MACPPAVPTGGGGKRQRAPAGFLAAHPHLIGVLSVLGRGPESTVGRLRAHTASRGRRTCRGFALSGRNHAAARQTAGPQQQQGCSPAGEPRHCEVVEHCSTAPTHTQELAVCKSDQTALCRLTRQGWPSMPKQGNGDSGARGRRRPTLGRLPWQPLIHAVIHAPDTCRDSSAVLSMLWKMQHCCGSSAGGHGRMSAAARRPLAAHRSALVAL